MDHPTTSRAFDIGTAVHTLVLGAGSPIAVLEHESRRSRECREEEQQARADGMTPVLAHEYAPIRAMADAVMAHPIARRIFEADGTAELSVRWDDPETGVPCRARPDWLTMAGSRHIIGDLKTALDASPRGFSRAVADHGYHQQDAWYRDGVRAAWGDPDPGFLLVVVEKSAPHLVAVYEPDREARTIGADRNYRARCLYRDCTETGTWPGYPDSDITLLSLPTWATYQHTEDYS
jgi:hypothetical protein